MPWFKATCAQGIGTMLLFNEFITSRSNRRIEIEVTQRTPRFPTEYSAGAVPYTEARSPPVGPICGCSRTESLGNPVCYADMPLCPFIRGNRLGRGTYIRDVAR
ncbi:MAG: hypothetical protein OXN89_11995 [Bryobacterales bacterium]|nr:hypothetical protein [Bryobacterales bacterium]